MAKGNIHARALQSYAGARDAGSSPSHRQALLIAGVVGIFVFRLFATGKTRKAWSALWGPGEKSTASSSVGASAGAGSSASGSGLFGFKPTYARTQTAWLGQDQGLVPGASVEYNFGTGGKSLPFDLPSLPGRYTLEQQSAGYNSGVGGEEVWKTPGGHLMGLLHLQQVSPFAVGEKEPGGSLVGMTGWPLAPQYAVGGITGPRNAHLAVILDPGAARELGL